VTAKLCLVGYTTWDRRQPPHLTAFWWTERKSILQRATSNAPWWLRMEAWFRCS